VTGDNGVSASASAGSPNDIVLGDDKVTADDVFKWPHVQEHHITRHAHQRLVLLISTSYDTLRLAANIQNHDHVQRNSSDNSRTVSWTFFRRTTTYPSTEIQFRY